VAITTARFRFTVFFAIDFLLNYGRRGSISQARLTNETKQECKNYKAAGDSSSDWAVVI
jgi:hypothetical protein